MPEGCYSPALRGIQLFQYVMDPGLRRGDNFGTFYEFINVEL